MSKKSNTKAAAFNQGIKPLDINDFLRNADSNDVRALMSRNFALWAAMGGIKVDGNPLEFNTHRYLLPIYMDHGKEMVWMKAAQLGATVYMLLKLMWYCRNSEVEVEGPDGSRFKRGPNVSLYFPTGGGVEDLAKARLNPMIASNDELVDNLTEVDTLSLKQFRNVHGTTSSLYMTYMGGKDSKDSTPLDVLAFDEVRLMDPQDIDQVFERFAHSPLKHRTYMSTAGFPDCFAGDTKVLVKDKRNNRIYSKNIADLVGTCENYQALSYNRRGGNRTRWRDITGAVCRGEKEVVKVTFWGGTSVVCTPNHRFSTLQTTAGGVSMQWVPISDVITHPKHFGGKHGPVEGVACVNMVQERENSQHLLAVAAAPYDLLTCRVLGFYIAEGSIATNGKEICMWQSPHKEDLGFVERWCKLNDLPYRRNAEGIFIQAKSREDLLDLFKSCGHGAPNKEIPEDVLSGTNAQITEVLGGIIAGDGHVRNDKDGRDFDIYTTSNKLASQILTIGVRIGKPMSVNPRPPREEHHFPSFVLSYNPNSFRNEEVMEDLGKVAVRSIEPSGKQLTYDLEIEGDPWFTLAESGALVHNCDIHERFLRGTQLTWHTKCGCPDGVVLPEVFPDCVVEHRGEVYYRCPKCKYRINDVQNGCYIPHNPGGKYNSYSVSQLNSAHISPEELFDFYKTTTNIKEFYNGKLGQPYVDEANRPITDDTFAACVDDSLKWQCNLPSQRVRGGCAMGVDQHSGNCYVTIMKRGKDGKKQIVHLEVIESKNPIYWEYDDKFGADGPVSPFKRLHQLMNEYGVGMCVIDMMPNANEAHELARKFPGKVFTAVYKESGQDLVLWGDRASHKEGVRKGGKEIKNKYQVNINRYLSLDYALRMWTEGIVELPAIGQLTPVVRSERKADKGRFVATPLALRLRDHLKRLVRQETVLDKDTGRSRMEWLYLGGDPHFAHAFSYCNIAMERLRHTAMFVM